MKTYIYHNPRWSKSRESVKILNENNINYKIVNYIKVNNLSQIIEKFKKNNFWVVGFDSNSNDSIDKVQLSKKCLMIFGAENQGLRKLTIKTCDQTLKISQNLNNQFGIESLNVSNACAIALYEYFKINN